jgi:hypothetical protein
MNTTDRIEYFRRAGGVYRSDNYAVAFFDNADEAAKAVGLLLHNSIGFETEVGPGEMYLILDQISFCDFRLDEELNCRDIAHQWIKSAEEWLLPATLEFFRQSALNDLTENLKPDTSKGYEGKRVPLSYPEARLNFYVIANDANLGKAQMEDAWFIFRMCHIEVCGYSGASTMLLDR